MLSFRGSLWAVICSNYAKLYVSLYNYITLFPHAPTISSQYMFAALRDCVPTLKWCKHQESSEVLLGMFEREVDGYMKERIFAPLCRDIEEDLRLSTHLHLKLDDRNPFKVCARMHKLPVVENEYPQAAHVLLVLYM